MKIYYASNVYQKEGVVITTLARYLLGEKCGNRLKTIDELATECRSSVGLTQAALKTLESSGAIRIERRGRNGSYLVEMDNKALLSHVDINNVVCAMPLPYTRLYEGLASGLKAQFDGIPFTMRTCAARIFAWSVYLTACMTWRLFPDWRRKVISRKRVMPRAGVGAAHLRWRAPVDLP